MPITEDKGDFMIRNFREAATPLSRQPIELLKEASCHPQVSSTYFLDGCRQKYFSSGKHLKHTQIITTAET